MTKKILFGIIGITLALAVVVWFGEGAKQVWNGKDGEAPVIVIDAGHGGFDCGYDPGTSGILSLTEKEINLSMAKKVKKILEENGCKVIMTREEDVALCEETDSHKKRADMKNRTDLINQSGAVLAVSIHQNSFGDPEMKGAQVFYHKNSKEGKELATIIQNQLLTDLQDGNTRKEKENDSYYMLKNTECPLVIVECGFLSNPSESALLNDEEYQEKIANSICQGILKYMETLTNKS